VVEAVFVNTVDKEVNAKTVVEAVIVNTIVCGVNAKTAKERASVNIDADEIDAKTVKERASVNIDVCEMHVASAFPLGHQNGIALRVMLLSVLCGVQPNELSVPSATKKRHPESNIFFEII
jgi:hypothetical protein